MRSLLYSVALFLLASACSVNPVPIEYGKDSCHFCKMTIMDKKFGGEVVSTKGKVYKFDDVNCMVNFLNTGELGEREISFRLVVDYSHPEKLIAAGEAFYVKSPEVKSPMASQVAAFETDENKTKFKKEWKGIYLTWGELITQFK